MISYELTLTMSVVGVLLMAGSFNLRDIINAQARHPEWGILGWNLWPQILGFFCFFTAAVAETNRVPFDLPEAESELVAGFHTEYASFKFAMFFIAEYTSMITVSCLCTIMFFGGWLSPFPASWTVTQYLPSVILIHLANISYRLGRTLHFDAETLTCKGDAEANKMFTRAAYRAPFVVPEKV